MRITITGIVTMRKQKSVGGNRIALGAAMAEHSTIIGAAAAVKHTGYGIYLSRLLPLCIIIAPYHIKYIESNNSLRVN